MKILFVNSMRSMGGGERWLLEVADGLRNRGHATAFAARAGSELGALLKADGQPVLELSMRNDFDPGSVAALARWASSLRCDVVSVNIERAVRIGSTAARLAGIRAVVERKGLLLPAKASAVNRFVYGRLVLRVIANCRAIADGIVRAGLVDGSRVTVIPNGIDPSRVPPGGGHDVRREFGIGGSDPLVVVMGRLARDKGHEVALRAFSRIVDEIPAARLLVVGEGRLRGELESAAAELVPPGSVTFSGHREDVPRILDAADVVLVTSLREGMPHVILEAMVAGTPVVATSVAGIPEMIEDGRHGLLVPPRSHDAAASAVRRLLSDRDLARRLADAACERVRAHFSLDTMIERVEECFSGAASGPELRGADERRRVRTEVRQ